MDNAHNLLNGRALKAFNSGNFKRAIRLFRAVLSKYEDSTALFHLALCLYETGKYSESLKYWRQLRQLCPNEANLYLNMGCAYQRIGKISLATKCFKTELQNNPTSKETLYSIGNLYYAARKYQLAVGFLERCYSLGHCLEDIIDKLAYSYFKTGQLDKEIALYESYLSDHPRNLLALNNMGAALMQLGEYNRAQKYLQKASMIDKSDIMVQRNLNKVKRIREKLP